jgi:predicted MFS family arabinose efflux permease
VFVVNLGRLVFAPLLEPLRRALTVDAAAVGLLATLVWIGSALLRLPTGYALTKFPRHYVVLATGLLLAGSSFVASVAPGIRALQASALMMGMASGAYFIAANPLVSELFPERIGQAIGIHGTASQLAAVGAPLFVSAVLAGDTWEATFEYIAALTLAATVLFTVAAWRTDLPDAGADDRDLLDAVRHQWRIVLTAVVILGVAGFVWQGVFNFYVSYLVAAKSVAEPTARQLLSLTFGAGVPAFLLSGRLSDRFPVVPYMLAVVGGFAAMLVVLTVTDGFLALAAVSVVLGFVIHSLFPAVDAYLLGTLPDRHRASAYAAYSATMMAIQAGGSGAVGLLVDAGVTFDLVFQAFAAVLLVVLAGLVVAERGGLLPTGAEA